LIKLSASKHSEKFLKIYIPEKNFPQIEETRRSKALSAGFFNPWGN